MTTFFRRVRHKVDEKVNQLQPPGDFFVSRRKWEIKELRKELSSSNIHRQKACLKRIIVNMTLGRDVSVLFVDVVKIGRTDNLELKKLVHLYILHNAKLRPDEALLVVNSFLIDLKSPSSLIRALVLRTMMSVCAHGVLEHTIDPLLRILASEKDAYVLKTAVLGAGKLFHYSESHFWNAFSPNIGNNGELMEPKLLLSQLHPSNEAIVCGNAAAVIKEILDYRKTSISTTLLGSDVFCLYKKLEEANEWSKIYILELLSELELKDARSIEILLRSVLPYLHHANAAVVLSTIKVLAKFVGRCPTTNLISAECISENVNAALRMLCLKDPETQYIVFKNIHLLIVIFPPILKLDVKTFFVHFDDPPYLKIEKVRLLVKLVAPCNADALLQEFEAYAREGDTVFVEEVVKSIGFLAVMIESLAIPCIKLLHSILDWHSDLQSAVLKAGHIIGRKYTELLEMVLKSTILASSGTPSAIRLKNLVGEGGKEAFFFLLGEYSKSAYHEKVLRILEGAAKYILQEEEPCVQLQFMRTLVIIWAKDPHRVQKSISHTNFITTEEEGHDAEQVATASSSCRVASLLHKVLQILSSRSKDADVRDRAVSYSRLLSAELTAQQIEKLVVALSPSSTSIRTVNSSFSDDMTLKDLKQSINTAAAILGCPSRSFLPPYGELGKRGNGVGEEENEDDEEDDEDDEGEDSDEEETTEEGGKASSEYEEPKVKRGDVLPSSSPSAHTLSGSPLSLSRRSRGGGRGLSSPTRRMGCMAGSRKKGSAFSSPPSNEEEFLLAWDNISEGNRTAQREMRNDLSDIELGRISASLSDNGFVVAAVISSVTKFVFMASTPSMDFNALFQWVVNRKPLPIGEKGDPVGSMVIVKGEKSHELVHVLALQLEKVSTNLAAEASLNPGMMSLESFFS